MEMEVFVKTPAISTVPYNFIKGNKILQPNILIYFNTNFNVIYTENNDCHVRWRWRVLNLWSSNITVTYIKTYLIYKLGATMFMVIIKLSFHLSCE